MAFIGTFVSWCVLLLALTVRYYYRALIFYAIVYITYLLMPFSHEAGWVTRFPFKHALHCVFSLHVYLVSVVLTLYHTYANFARARLGFLWLLIVFVLHVFRPSQFALARQVLPVILPSLPS